MNKKIIILYFLSTLHLMFALEFNINAGREAGKNFAVLSIMDDREFLCEEVFNKESEVQSVLCSFSSQLISRFSKSSDTLFFSILPEVKDGK